MPKEDSGIHKKARKEVILLIRTPEPIHKIKLLLANLCMVRGQRRIGKGEGERRGPLPGQLIHPKHTFGTRKIPSVITSYVRSFQSAKA